MRKIGSSLDIEKRKKRNVIIMSIIMLFILVGGTAGFAFIYHDSSQNAQSTGSNSHTQQAGDKWQVRIGDQVLPFSNHPDTLESIPVEIQSNINNYAGKPLYLDSNSPTISSEIASTLGTYASRVQYACFGECSSNLPEKDCSENIIVWEDSQANSVYQQDNCIFIEGDLRAVDAFLYKVLGVN